MQSLVNAAVAVLHVCSIVRLWHACMELSGRLSSGAETVTLNGSGGGGSGGRVEIGTLNVQRNTLSPIASIYIKKHV